MDWLLRIGDGEHFIASSTFNIWAINSKNSNGKHFIRNVKNGDRLWFIKNRSKGLILAMAKFDKLVERDIGELIALTPTNEELGWTKTDGDWDMEVHYTDLIILSDCKLLTEIKTRSVILKYNDSCKINLPLEYKNIQRYRNIKYSF